MSVKARSNTPFTRARQAYQRAWESRDFSGAEKHARKLVNGFPEQGFSWRALGASLIELKRPEQALPPLAEATRIAPDDAQAAYLAGAAHSALKQWDQAKMQLQRAVDLDPGHAMAHAKLAQVYQTTRQFELALKHISDARKLQPDNSVVLALSINIHSSASKMADVLDDCEKLLTLDKNNPTYYNLAAIKHCEMGLFAKGAEYYKQALTLKPDLLEAFSNWIFNAHYDPAMSSDDIAALITRWRNTFSPESRPARPDTARETDRPLTLGLLSAGLRIHPVGQMIISALEQLPADQFRLIAYATGDIEDHLSARLQQLCSGWHRMKGASDDVLDARIRKDNVDILIDLSGHTDGNRLSLITREPAPLIVKWVGGLVNTTGLDAMDYLISDAIETPAGVDDHYYEKLIRLPDDYICYMPPAYAPAVGELPALRDGIITFGCLNNPAKINDVLIDEWATLLHEIENSQLLLRSSQYSDPTFCERIWQRFEAAGIERARVLMEGPTSHNKFLDTYNRIDIALDPWPYSGGLTTCEALLMGVPVITLPGPTFAGRHAATHLVNAGLPELVVNSWDEYRARARELVSDLDSLATIRQHLREILKQSPVCDAPRFAGHLSAALRAIWLRHCKHLPPAALSFDADGKLFFAGDAMPVALPEASGPSLLDATKAQGGDTFKFDFTGKVITLDNGGYLLDKDMADTLKRLGAFELLVFDPLGRHGKHQAIQQNGLQYFPNALLGDGQPATHYACLDPDDSATLKPPADTRVLAELPIQSVALRSIEGLPSLDWLLLDDRSDNLSVLTHGGDLLGQVLLMQVRVRLGAQYQGQPGLADLITAAEAAGFRLYRLNNEVFSSHFPETVGAGRQATDLSACDAIFVPADSRLQNLDDNRKLRLAFLLHTVYGIQDFCYGLLQMVEPVLAERYLASLDTQTSDTSPEQPIPIPDAPCMSDPERRLFERYLKQAQRYFEFGAGGSTVLACGHGLTVHGVESDEKWVNALKQRLGEHCQVQAIDIGPTREWGFPVSNHARARFPDYSEAILQHECSFDLILVDGRFRVACVLNAIRHTLRSARSITDTRLFIHDFWNRQHYHSVLEFLVVEESAETAGVFRIKPDLDTQRLAALLDEYRYRPD